MVKSDKKTMKIEQQNPVINPNPVIISENTKNNDDINKKKYKGVRMRSWGSWVSEIRAPNQKTRIWLGSYSTADAAARAYDAALLCLKGSNANFNFPNSSRRFPNDIPNDVVLSPKSIQRVAAAAAAAANYDNAPTFADNDDRATASVAAAAAENFSSSFSSSSSSSVVSSPSDCYHDHHQQQPTAVMEALHSFDASLDQYSPRMMMMMTSSSFYDDPHMTMMSMDDHYEESGDIRLWSFC